MANPSCIWLKDKTCYRAVLPKANEYLVCTACVAATDLADRSTNFDIKVGMGPQ